MHDEQFPVIGVGSVAQKSRLWWERLCVRIHELAPAAEPLLPKVKPVVGGALLALKEMGVEWTPGLLERILATQEPHLRAADERESRQAV
mgnify:FL=1